MANKALGRDLGDLLTRARPARLVERAGEAGPRFGHGPRSEAAPPTPPEQPPTAPAPDAVASSGSAPIAPDSETLSLPLEGIASASPANPAAAPEPGPSPYVHKPSRSPYVTYPAPSNWRSGERGYALRWPLRRVIFWSVDAVLVVVAMVCAFGGFLGEGLGKGLAIGALLVGAVLFWLGSRSAEPASAAVEPNPPAPADPELAFDEAAAGSPSLLVDPPSPPASKIRVHLTRV